MSKEYFYHVQAFERIRDGDKLLETGEVEHVVLMAPSSREAIKRVAQGFKEDGTYTGLQTWLAPRISHKQALQCAEKGYRIWCEL